MKNTKLAAIRQQNIIDSLKRDMRTAAMRHQANNYGAANFAPEAIFEIRQPRAGVWKGGC